jgi:hypothetical protein
VPWFWSGWLLVETTMSGCDKNPVFGTYTFSTWLHPHFVRLTRHHFLLLFVLRISTATTLVKTPSTPPFQITLVIYPNQLKFQAIKCGLRYKIVWRRLLLKRLGKVGRLAEHFPTIIFVLTVLHLGYRRWWFSIIPRAKAWWMLVC